MTDSRRRHHGAEDESAAEPEQDGDAEGAWEEEQTDVSAVPAEELLPDEEEREAPSEIEVLQGEMALLEQQLEQMRDRYIRAVADLDNARKRARQAIGDARRQAVGDVLVDLLPLLDNFERALETVAPGPDGSDETRQIYDGIGLIYRQLRDMLEQRGVRPIEAIDRAFDPSCHEAVARVPADDEHAEGTVVLELQKGYMYGDRVLRPSRVGVVVRESEAEDEE